MHTALYIDNIILINDIMGATLEQMDCANANVEDILKFIGKALRKYDSLLLTLPIMELLGRKDAFIS